MAEPKWNTILCQSACVTTFGNENLLFGRITKAAQFWCGIEHERIEDNGIIETEIGSSVRSQPKEPEYHRNLRGIHEALNDLRARPGFFSWARTQKSGTFHDSFGSS
jgi:hypothetical protein